MERLWIDDVIPAPKGYTWMKSVSEAFSFLLYYIPNFQEFRHIILLDLDDDAGEFAKNGGDYINLLNWIEEDDLGKYFTFHIHSQNPVGAENMRRIIKRNGWKEV